MDAILARAAGRRPADNVPLKRMAEEPDSTSYGSRSDRHRSRLEELGHAPDPRFTFANERTFLAWNRTALALIAAGLAAAQFLDLGSRGVRLIIALPLIGLGGVLAFTSYRRWEHNERALRLDEPLHYSRTTWLVGVGIALIAVVAAVLAIVDAAIR